MYSEGEEIHLRQGDVVFSVDSETLAQNWMPRSEALPFFSEIGPGVVYVASQPEFFGVMPVRTELTVLPSRPNWIQTGTRLQPISGSGESAVIVGILGDAIHIREVERWTSPLTLGTTVRSYTTEQLIELYRPLPPLMPSWFTVGSRIIQNVDGRTYIVLSFDPHRWTMSVTLEDEMRPTVFSVSDFIRHWRPASSISEQRPGINATQIAQSRVQVPPEWLQPGAFLRRLAPPHHVFVVSFLDPSRFTARLTRLDSITPRIIGTTFEEVEYCRVKDLFSPVDSEGSPQSEYKCPKCSGIGVRDHDAEARRASIDVVRAYTCKQEHTWYFVAGTDQDGKPANPSRFERDIGI